MSMHKPILSVLYHSWRTLLLSGIVFAVGMQFMQLILLIVRFGDIPNYAIHYDWLSSVSVIHSSTPSFRDMLNIVFEEWWIEIGFMNYDYGNGISEWSLNVIPSRLLMLVVMGAMISMLILLRKQSVCHSASHRISMAGAGLGTVMMCMTTAAMSWVVCCATPSWVVGLAMLGLGVSTSLALEDMGPLLFGSGFGLLSVSILLLAHQQGVSLQEHNRSAKHVDPLDGQQRFSTVLNRIR